MKSHVCWHGYGLLYHCEKNCNSIKSYKIALRLVQVSQQILRDPALLQILIRNDPRYVQSRGKILQRGLQFRQNWTGLSAAHHLAGSYLEAEDVLRAYGGTLRNPPGIGDIEHSEVYLYTVDTTLLNGLP